MHYFAITKSPNNIYNILVNSCKKDAEKKLNKSKGIVFWITGHPSENEYKLTAEFLEKALSGLD